MLHTVRVGRRVHYLPVTTSTNDEAWALLEKGDADGAVVLADHQSAGRGRFKRSWHAPRGSSVLMSLVLVEKQPKEIGAWLGLLAGVAMWDAVHAISALTPTIKWPNDLLLRGRKVAGALVESRMMEGGKRAYVVGIGMNCLQHHGHFPPDIAESATSLEIESHDAVDRHVVVVALLSALDQWLASPNAWTQEDVRDAWINRAGSIGHLSTCQAVGRNTPAP